MLDLEEILMEFALSFANNPPSPKASSGDNAMELFNRVRKFAKKHKQTPDLLTQYQTAIDQEQYEIAHILKKQITDIIEQKNGLRKRHKN